MTQPHARIAWLDGLRGLAILAVAAWHYTYVGHAEHFPYGQLYATIPLLDHGWAGVNLFFLISGFVIVMTLERAGGYRDFLRRRWLRLFPAMLVASLLIFAASRLIGADMPHGHPPPANLLPGLTFLSPPFWSALLGRPVDELDGVFWTLYVEAGFYLIFGLLHARLGWQKGLAALAAVWLTLIAATRLAPVPLLPWLAPLQWLGIEYFGWFVAGALFCKARGRRPGGCVALALLAGGVSAMTSDLWQPGDSVSRAYLFGVLLLFAAATRLPRLQRLLSARALLVAGVASYPLYLLHNELGVGLIAVLGRALPRSLAVSLPLVMLAAMLALAWCVAVWVEPPLRRALAALTDWRCALSQGSRPPS